MGGKPWEETNSVQYVADWSQRETLKSSKTSMSEQHFDQYEHYNYDQEKTMFSGRSGKQRSKKEAEQHTNHHNPAGHERKIETKLKNMEANKRGQPKQ